MPGFYNKMANCAGGAQVIDKIGRAIRVINIFRKNSGFSVIGKNIQAVQPVFQLF